MARLGTGEMRGVVAWLRQDLRGQWRSLAGLAVLIAVSAAIVLAVTAGARRGESAMRRLQAQALPVTALVAPGSAPLDWAAMRRMPQVESMATLTMSGLAFEGDPQGRLTFYLPETSDLLRTLERPVLLQGRLPDPARVDEAVVTSRFVTTFGHGQSVGTSLVPQIALGMNVAPRHEPWLPERLTVVGVVRSPLLSDGPNSLGQVVLTPALLELYRAHRPTYIGALVRLRGGAAALPSFRAELIRTTGALDLDIQDSTVEVARLQRLATFESQFVLAHALAALFASLVLVGPLVVRHVAASEARLRVPRGFGMTPRQVLIAAAAGPALAAVAGISVSVLTSALASTWFPIGSAAAYEPSPGILPDWLVLACGWVLVPAAVLAGSLGAAAWAGRRIPPTAALPRSLVVVNILGRIGAPASILVGARMALETGRGRSAVPARLALIGATAGVVGIVTSFVFAGGVKEASTNPARFGQNFSLGLFEDSARRTPRLEQALTAVVADRDIAAVSDSRISVATAGDRSHTPITMLSLEPRGRMPGIVILSGRLPRSATEVLLGPESAAASGATLGSPILVRGDRASHEMTVTGLGFVLESWRNSHASGGWVTSEGFDALFRDYQAAAGLVEVKPGVPPSAVRARLNPVLERRNLPTLDEAQAPVRLGEIQQVRGLPDVLGAVLALLAVGAMAHALFTGARTRRQEFGIMRALGMTGRSARLAVLTQGVVIASIALVFGVPLGLAAGRVLWRIFADYVPLLYAPPPATELLAVVVSLTIATAALLAARPGHYVARLLIADVLRAE
jgi:hypothetical protein